MKIIVNVTNVFVIGSRVSRFYFETEEALGTDVNNVIILHALCREKNIVYFIISSRLG